LQQPLAAQRRLVIVSPLPAAALVMARSARWRAAGGVNDRSYLSMPEATTQEAATPQNGNEAGGAGVFVEKRRTPRHEVRSSVTIEGRSPAGEPFALPAVSKAVSPGGGSFSFTGAFACDASVLDRITVGQEVTVVTSLDRLRGQINGKWLEPKDARAGETQYPHVGIKLLDGKTWV
jgi:hypothetical protein